MRGRMTEGKEVRLRVSGKDGRLMERG